MVKNPLVLWLQRVRMGVPEMMVSRSATSAVVAEELGDVEVVERSVAVGVAGDELVVEEVDEVGDIVEVQNTVGVVIGWAGDKTRLGRHGLDIEPGLECTSDDAGIGVHLMDDAVGPGDVEHALECDRCVGIGVDAVCPGVVDATFELIEHVYSARLGTTEGDAREVHGVAAEGHGLDLRAAGGEKEEVVLADVCTYGEGGVSSHEEPAGVKADGGDVGAGNAGAVVDAAAGWVDIVDATSGVCDDKLIAKPGHGTGVVVDREGTVDKVGDEIVGVNGPDVIAQVEGASVNGHRVDWARANAAEGDRAGIGIESMDCALRSSKEDCVSADAGCENCDRECDCAWGVHDSVTPVFTLNEDDMALGELPFSVDIFVDQTDKPPPLFGGDGQSALIWDSGVFGTCPADEVREQFATGRDAEVAVDCEHMVVDGGFSDIEVVCDLFFRIAHEQSFENFLPSLGEFCEFGFIGCGEIRTDLTVDDHVEHRDECAFALGEITRADAFVEPEGGASIRDCCWANRDDVVVDAALSVDLVEGVGSVPGLASPDLVSREDESLTGELVEVGELWCSFDGDGLSIFAPAFFCFDGDPAISMSAEISGFLLVAFPEVLNLGVDDDLRIDEGTQFGEQLGSPRVDIGAEIAASPGDLVALVDISRGEFGEHGVLSVSDDASRAKGLLGSMLLSAGAAEFGRVFIAAAARETSIGGGFVDARYHAIGVDDVAQVFERVCFDMTIAEHNVCFSSVSCVWCRTMFDAAISSVREVVVVGKAGRIDGVTVSALGAEAGVSGAVVFILDSIGCGLAGCGAQGVGEHHGACAIERRCSHREVDEAVGFIVVDEASVAEELVVVAESVVAGVVPFRDDWAEENLVAIDSHGVLVFTVGAGIGERVETGRGTDDSKPAGSVLPAVAQLIDVPIFVDIPAGLSWDGYISVCVGVYLPAGGDLPHAGGAEHGFGGFAGAGEGWQEDADNERSDGDHHEQFDESECVWFGNLCIRTVHRVPCSVGWSLAFHKLGVKGECRENDSMIIAPNDAAIEAQRLQEAA